MLLKARSTFNDFAKGEVIKAGRIIEKDGKQFVEISNERLGKDEIVLQAVMQLFEPLRTNEL